MHWLQICLLYFTAMKEKNRFISIDIVLFIIFLLGQGCNDCFCSLMDTSSSCEEYNQEYKNLNKSMPKRDAPHLKETAKC